MSVDRLTRVNELLKREIGGLLFRIMNENNFDLSAVTVTHVITSRNLRSAKVLISIRNHQKDRGRMLSLLRKHRSEIQQQINAYVNLKYTPRLTFELDTSLEEGDRILHMLSELEKSNPALQDTPPAHENTTA